MVIAYILQTVLGAFFWRTFARENLKQSVIISALILPNVAALIAILVVELYSILNRIEEVLRK